MAALIGWLFYGHHAGEIHRLAHRNIRAKIATWHGSIESNLDKDGTGSVSVNGKVVWQGNINEKE